VQQALFGKIVVDPESLRMLMFGLALILVMLWRPAGLWPSSQRRRELMPDETVSHQEQDSVYDSAK
jgi:branched-chain amino acid transport system permease protein